MFEAAEVQPAAQPETLDETIGKSVQRRVIFPLAVFFLLVQMMSAIDRSNISFAAVPMNHDLGFDARIYGFGIASFFLGYIGFQFPAAFAMRRFGPSKTLATIILSWAVVAMATAAAVDRYSFFALRFLLGATEAGAAPVMIYYASCWIPQKSQGYFLKTMTLSWPLSVVIGAPLASLLMNHLATSGLPGWRLLFLAEGLPTLALGLFALWRLVDTPSEARGLSESGRDWLVSQIERDRTDAQIDSAGMHAGSVVTSALYDRRAWLLALAYFGEISGLYGCVFWLPQVIGQLSPAIGSNIAVLLSIVPFGVGCIALLVNAAMSDRKQERSWHTASGFLFGAIGLGAAGLLRDPWLGFWALTVGTGGLCAAVGLFWSIPTGFFRGSTHSAAVFTLINVMGNFSGVVMPPLVGEIRIATGRFAEVLLLLACLLFISACLVRFVGEPGRRRGAL